MAVKEFLTSSPPLPSGSLVEADARSPQFIVFTSYSLHLLLKIVLLYNCVEKFLFQAMLGINCFLKLQIEILHLRFKRRLSLVCHWVQAPEPSSNAVRILLRFVRRCDRRGMTACNDKIWDIRHRHRRRSKASTTRPFSGL